MQSQKITVVRVDALSYSGTTWLNLVLGSHPKAFTLGPPHRVWKLKDCSFNGANLVWGTKDTFWTGFDKFWDRNENFLLALARYRGCSHIVFDNPAPDFVRDVITHPDIQVKTLKYLRDARAITASYARKFPETSYLNSILPSGWFYPSYMALAPQPDSTTRRTYYYEKCLKDPHSFLATVGPYLGLNFDESALRFWEADHHITVGNQGAIGLVRLAKGIQSVNFNDREFYASRLKSLKVDPINGFVDDRWVAQLTRLDRLYFDVLMGAKHAELGYERDVFSDDEVTTLLAEHGARVANHGSADLPADILASYLAHREKAILPVEPEYSGATQNSATERQSPNFITMSRSIQRGKSFVSSAKHTAKHLALRATDRVKARTHPDALKAQAAVGNRTATAIEDALITTAEVRPFPKGLPTTGLHYFDEIPSGAAEYFKPYVVRPSKTPLSDVLQLANWNIYHAHGPDYDDKSAYRIVFDSPCRYRELLEGALSVKGTRFMTARDMIRTKPGPDEIICHVRHDVDADIQAALQQARIEAHLGIATTYYVLHTAPYWGTWNGDVFERHEETGEIYKEIASLGHEIALHTDGLGLYQFQQTDGAEGLKSELAWLRSLGIEVDGSVTHNSFGVYGAENFAIFKNRPLGLTRPGGPKAVVNNGKLALLQQLDEKELGFHYEGNDFFGQTAVPIQYYALRGMNDWRYQAYNALNMAQSPERSSTDPAWMSQEDVVDHLSKSARGVYAMFIVHPEYYGMRADETSKGVEACDAPAPNAKLQVGWYGFEPGTISQRQAFVDGKTERQSVTKINRLGFADVPPEYIQNLDERIVFLGKDQIASDALSVENKVPHALVRLLRRGQNRQAGATSLAGRLAPLSVRLAWLSALPDQISFTHAVLSVGLSDAISEDSARLAHAWGLDLSTAMQLTAGSFDRDNPSLTSILSKHERLSPFVSLDPLELTGGRSGKPAGSLTRQFQDGLPGRIRSAVDQLRKRNLTVVLFLEDCGESLGLRLDRLSAIERTRIVSELSTYFAAIAQDCNAAFINPYDDFMAYKCGARTHWHSDGQWAIHGHTLAAKSLLAAFAKRETVVSI